eukprot:766646-Hanusia_phi.AAC.1
MRQPAWMHRLLSVRGTRYARCRPVMRLRGANEETPSADCRLLPSGQAGNEIRVDGEEMRTKRTTEGCTLPPVVRRLVTSELESHPTLLSFNWQTVEQQVDSPAFWSLRIIELQNKLLLHNSDKMIIEAQMEFAEQ